MIKTLVPGDLHPVFRCFRDRPLDLSAGLVDGVGGGLDR